MTLAELVISVAITAIVVASMSLATSVILRQMDNTTGRANNARSEQQVAIYMPTDLSSAESVDVTAGAVPCGPSPACPAGTTISGSNALMMTWTGSAFISNTVVPTVTKVSYRVVQVGIEFQMWRVECTTIGAGNPTCNTRVVLRKLPNPPPGFTWTPGVTPPSWIMTVSQAAAADDTTSANDPITVDPGLKNKNAQRVVVTINGGGDVAGIGGGQNQISLSAGGTNRETQLATDDLSGAPTFTAARSRCGGNYGVIVDTSGSIGGDLVTVKGGVDKFVAEFAGTPVKLQVVTFSSTSTTLGAGGGWSKYYDMLIETDVSALRTLVGNIPAANGYTNWEDGFFRMLKNSDGTVQANLPKTILFFTDGMPTKSRLDGSSASAAAVADPLDVNLPTTDNYLQIGWNRAERLIRDRGTIDIVGVFVSSDAEGSSDWITAGAGYKWVWERGNTVVYEAGTPQRGNTVVYARNNNVTYQYSGTGISYEKKVSGSWVPASGSSATSNASRNAYFSGNTVPSESDNWRARISGTLGTWTTISGGLSDYNESNLVSGPSDGFQTTVGSLSGSWTTTTAALYDISNTTTAESDGWRAKPSSTPASWVTVTKAQYDASNTVSGPTTAAAQADGWRINWVATTSALYDSNNTTSDESDLWRLRLTGTPASWATVTQAQYDASNTTTDESDGWRVTKTYAPPYTGYDANVTKPIKNYALVGNFVVDNTTGNAGVYVPATRQNDNGTPTIYTDDTGEYTNAGVADLFVLPDYDKFKEALSTIALGQCGGTVTVQTRINGVAALDPFTYENTSTHEVVTTSAAYRSGTFDVALPGGSSTSVTISPQEFTNLTSYAPVSWSCKSGGNNYAFTPTTVPGHAPWSSITLTVSPNQAVSCIQNVVSA